MLGSAGNLHNYDFLRDYTLTLTLIPFIISKSFRKNFIKLYSTIPNYKGGFGVYLAGLGPYLWLILPLFFISPNDDLFIGCYLLNLSPVSRVTPNNWVI